MDEFYEWLQKEGYQDSTATEHVATVRRFCMWALGAHGGYRYLKYREVLQYVQEEKQRGVQPQSINLRLASIRLYYDHLQEEGVREDNPAKRIHIKGAVKKVTQNVLSYSELENLYHAYVKHTEGKQNNNPQHEYAKRRNISVLGLLIFQGIQSGELSKLRTEYLSLKTGTIYLPSGSRSNSRELKLEPLQIVALHTYHSQISPQEEYLFKGDLLQVVNYIIKELQGLNPLIRNAQQIRSSVLIHWLKVYGKRQVQYMAGHRYISSTEKYERQDMDKLTDQLSKHHPFGS